jgi:hypothetical protein
MRPTVTSIPMINVRLSNFGAAATAAAVASGIPGVRPVSNALSAALSQTNQFLEGNAVVNRHTSVMFSREVLVFYVDRRSYVYTAGTTLTNLARLPTSIAGFERINDIALEWEFEIPIGGFKSDGMRADPNGDVFEFCSAVVADVNTSINPAEGGNYVVGSSTIVRNVQRGTAGGYEYYHYTPSTCIFRNSSQPIIPIDEDDMASGELGWKSLVTTRGTILVYTNPAYQDKPLSF